MKLHKGMLVKVKQGTSVASSKYKDKIGKITELTNRYVCLDIEEDKGSTGGFFLSEVSPVSPFPEDMKEAIKEAIQNIVDIQ